jgi:hypothetical protein
MHIINILAKGGSKYIANVIDLFCSQEVKYLTIQILFPSGLQNGFGN